MANLSPVVITPDREAGSMKDLAPRKVIRYPLLQDRPNTQNLRVLLADDSEAERQSTLQQLGEAWPFARGLVVEGAADGAEVLRKVRHYTYALVVLDWNLPPMGGMDVLRAIRTEGRRVPVVVVSAQPREAIANDLESLAAAFICKNNLDPIRFQNAMAGAILLQRPTAQVEFRRPTSTSEQFSLRTAPVSA